MRDKSLPSVHILVVLNVDAVQDIRSFGDVQFSSAALQKFALEFTRMSVCHFALFISMSFTYNCNISMFALW